MRSYFRAAATVAALLLGSVAVCIYHGVRYIVRRVFGRKGD